MASWVKDAVEGLAEPITGIFKELIPDKDKQAEFQLQLSVVITGVVTKLFEAQKDIIIAEAKSESWLTRNWRPLTMVTFVGLISAHWLGFSAPNLTPEERLSLLNLVKIGLGGYVVSRGIEKTAKEIGPILKR